ncbi:S24 family peptidase [Massilibacteroides sp.]|uniref:S24 family peptidase n=1 Tax=Massilibacteroides sp. TaxID=2034766 RepID=UPI002635AD88|nr:S24 family peptidase [Massilibacteroides sp.]MDD4515829.1 S24 family peptidase [Massilibacteroides sp.]
MIKERVTQIAKSKGIKKEIFFSRIGTTSANFRGKAKNTPLSSSTIENILSEFPDINLEWLITGKGEIYMTKQDSTKCSELQSLSSFGKYPVKLYDVNKITSLKAFFEGKEGSVLDEIYVPNAPFCDGAIYITGDNMYPLLKSGDIVMYKIMANLNHVIYGEMYLLSIKFEKDSYVTVNYICKSEKSGCYKLVSYNPHYSPKDVLISSIDAIALVKVSIRQNTMV